MKNKNSNKIKKISITFTLFMILFSIGFVSAGFFSDIWNALFPQYSPGDNLILNPGFESGTTNWNAYVSGQVSLSTGQPGSSSDNAGMVSILLDDVANHQLQQKDIVLEPNKQYTLKFDAKSTGGRDVYVAVLKNVDPYTNYGLSQIVNLNSDWTTHTIQFTSSSSASSDTRLMFKMDQYDQVGDEYWFDNFELTEVSTTICIDNDEDYYFVQSSGCENEPGFLGHNDCDDNNPNIHPGAEEICGNGIDEDCSGEDLPCSECINGVLLNYDFESGNTNSWNKYSDGEALFTASTPGKDSMYSGKFSVITAGSNVQFYQYGFTLNPNKNYRLSFDGYSNTGHNVRVKVLKHSSPYDGYGLNKVLDLTNSWKRFNESFTTPSEVSDPRITFLFSDYDSDGDEYFIDNVCLEEISSPICTDSDQDHYFVQSSGCENEPGFLGHNDCDDNNPNIHPGAEEICGNGIDEDCSGEDLPCVVTCIDNDGDGYGNPGDPSCRNGLATDCDDNNPNIHPGAEEICGNGIDEDCSGEDRECGVCLDRDNDGYDECNPGEEGDDGKIKDCDDNNPNIHPGAEEICGNGIDEDCDGHDVECPCILTEAYWSNTLVEEGTLVTLTVKGENCVGKEVNFEILENDIVGNDPVNINPANKIFSSGTLTTTWIAEYQVDVFDPLSWDFDPEYFFIAKLISDESINIKSLIDLKVLESDGDSKVIRQFTQRQVSKENLINVTLYTSIKNNDDSFYIEEQIPEEWVIVEDGGGATYNPNILEWAVCGECDSIVNGICRINLGGSSEICCEVINESGCWIDADDDGTMERGCCVESLDNLKYEYTVQAPSSEGDYAFTGNFMFDSFSNSVITYGESVVTVGVYCGDGICEGDETCSNCPQDCGVCPIICGDGECNGNEICGDTNNPPECNEDCGTCPANCQNNILEEDEVCDGIHLRGETCLSQGYQFGSLSCCPDCLKFNLEECYNKITTCIDNDINSGNQYLVFSNSSSNQYNHYGANCFGNTNTGNIVSNTNIDSCLNSEILREAICNGGEVGFENYNCSLSGRICDLGRCIVPNCIPDLINDTSSWENISCVENKMNQTRKIVQYDKNNCIGNQTFIEYRWILSCNPFIDIPQVHINYSEFDMSETTDFSKLNTSNSIKNISEFKIKHKTKGVKLEFLENITLTENIYLNNKDYFKIEEKFIYLDINRFKDLKKSARITFYNVAYINPQIYRNGALCSSDVCKDINYSQDKNIYSFVTTSFSDYELIQGNYCGDGICRDGESCSNCPQDCGSCGSSPKKSTVTPSSLDFEVDKKIISLSMNKNEETEIEFTIYNSGKSSLDLTLSSDLGMIVLQENKFKISSGASKIIKAKINTGNNVAPNLYVGRIFIKSQNLKKEILISIEVVSGNALFDVSLKKIKTKVYQGGNLDTTFSLLKLSEKGSKDIIVNYIIKNNEGAIVYTEGEKVHIEGSKELTKSIQLPKNLEKGDYLFYLKVLEGDSKGEIASASHWFEIKENNSIKIFAITFILLLVTTIVFVIVLLAKNYKKTPASINPNLDLPK